MGEDLACTILHSWSKVDFYSDLFSVNFSLLIFCYGLEEGMRKLPEIWKLYYGSHKHIFNILGLKIKSLLNVDLTQENAPEVIINMI